MGCKILHEQRGANGVDHRTLLHCIIYNDDGIPQPRSFDLTYSVHDSQLPHLVSALSTFSGVLFLPGYSRPSVLDSKQRVTIGAAQVDAACGEPVVCQMPYMNSVSFSVSESIRLFLFHKGVVISSVSHKEVKFECDFTFNTIDLRLQITPYTYRFEHPSHYNPNCPTCVEVKQQIATAIQSLSGHYFITNKRASIYNSDAISFEYTDGTPDIEQYLNQVFGAVMHRGNINAIRVRNVWDSMS